MLDTQWALNKPLIFTLDLIIRVLRKIPSISNNSDLNYIQKNAHFDEKRKFCNPGQDWKFQGGGRITGLFPLRSACSIKSKNIFQVFSCLDTVLLHFFLFSLKMGTQTEQNTTSCWSIEIGKLLLCDKSKPFIKFFNFLLFTVHYFSIRLSRSKTVC